jgi:hypothetical protein
MQQLHGFTIGLTLGALGASALFLAPSAQEGRGQAPGGQPPASQGPDEQMMARMAELAAPGEPHRLLAQGAGEWALTHKMRMSADLPWLEAQGRMQAKMLLGGRWLQQEIDIDMGPMGQMQGFQLIGYDNLAQEYVAFWLDSFSTWPVMSRGKAQADGSIDFHGTMVDVAGERPFRMLTSQTPDGRALTRMFDTIPPHGEIEVMSVEATRKP